MLSHFDDRLAVFLGRVVNQISVQTDIRLLVQIDNSAASVLEGTQALPSVDFLAHLDTRVVYDASDCSDFVSKRTPLAVI